MYNSLNIYIEQYVSSKKLAIRHSISEEMLSSYSFDDEHLIIEATIIAYKQFKQEKEMELENLKYAPKEAMLPLPIGRLKDPSMEPNFYGDSNA